MHLLEIFFVYLFVCANKKHYLCNVFFIVLDLRLTKVGTQRSPFFCALM